MSAGNGVAEYHNKSNESATLCRKLVLPGWLCSVVTL